MNVRPLQDRILVRRVEEVEKTRGGIIIPDSAKERPLEGNVVAVGSGKRLEDGTLVQLDVKAGDRILFGKYSGSEVKIDDEEYLIMKEEDVLGILG
jgi:chaperonin GroES